MQTLSSLFLNTCLFSGVAINFSTGEVSATEEAGKFTFKSEMDTVVTLHQLGNPLLVNPDLASRHLIVPFGRPIEEVMTRPDGEQIVIKSLAFSGNGEAEAPLQFSRPANVERLTLDPKAFILKPGWRIEMVQETRSVSDALWPILRETRSTIVRTSHDSQLAAIILAVAKQVGRVFLVKTDKVLDEHLFTSKDLARLPVLALA